MFIGKDHILGGRSKTEVIPALGGKQRFQFDADNTFTGPFPLVRFSALLLRQEMNVRAVTATPRLPA